MSNIDDPDYQPRTRMLSQMKEHNLLAEIDRLTKVCESLRSTLRDEFGGRALQGLMANPNLTGTPGHFASVAWLHADAMLVARDQPKPTEKRPEDAPGFFRELSLLHEVRDAAMAVDAHASDPKLFLPRLRVALKQLYAECYTAPQEPQP